MMDCSSSSSKRVASSLSRKKKKAIPPSSSSLVTPPSKLRRGTCPPVTKDDDACGKCSSTIPTPDIDQQLDDMVLGVITRSPKRGKMRLRTLEHCNNSHNRDEKHIASTERMTRNTDSMLEDAVIAAKLKRRLCTRRQAHRKSIANSDLSEFIVKSISEGSLDAAAAAKPTDASLSFAANAALCTCMEGYFTSTADSETKAKAMHIFMESLSREEFHDGDMICRQNDDGDKLYVIEEGTVEFAIGDLVAGTAKAGSLFGEIALVYGVPRESDVKVVTHCAIIWTMDALAFRRIQALVATESLKASTSGERTAFASPPLSPVASPIPPTKEAKASRLKTLKKQHSSLTDQQERSKIKITSPIKMKQLKKEAIVGKGTFGSVYMVSRHDQDEAKKHGQDSESPVQPQKQEYYGLKCMSKESIVQQGNEKRVLIERNALQAVDSPFIVTLLSTYQDANSIYFLTDFIQGGTLMKYMIDKDILSHAECTFFAANIAAALVHIHTRGFVNRDVKPENCLIGKDGYIKLCDFGMAKRLPCTVRLPSGGTEVVTLAFTMCGTPEFLAPEFVLSTGYDKGVDLWALGCILVEMYTGKSPFEFGGNLKATFKEVCMIGMGRKKLETPEALNQPGLETAEDIAQRLLTSESDRLGRHDSSDVLRHDYFDEIDFDGLYAKTIVAPYIPSISHDADTSHFDDVSDSDSDQNDEGEVDLGPENRVYDGEEEWCKNF
mmetsp:Transcript_36556/g.74457  ORF Transcript_36556/g.74457 Transcript_36556/m.74457 type:complete len:723 (-) Transcript_36556:169-2337(-)